MCFVYKQTSFSFFIFMFFEIYNIRTILTICYVKTKAKVMTGNEFKSRCNDTILNGNASLYHPCVLPVLGGTGNKMMETHYHLIG